MQDRQRVIVALRAFGDFTILLSYIKNLTHHTAIKVVASTHLKPLYDALLPHLQQSITDVVFVNFGIKGSLLSYFTNKQLFSIATIQELGHVFAYLNKEANANLFIEQHKRASIFSVFANKKIQAIVTSSENVYKAYARFFNAELPKIEPLENPKKILVLPTSRQSKKNFTDAVIRKMLDKHCDAEQTTVAFYGASKTSYPSTISYHHFTELIELIRSYDFIYCADSAQVHICAFLQKPHFIVYPNKHTLFFATPFALEHNSFDSFDHFLNS
jgi:hypothetical protein